MAGVACLLALPDGFLTRRKSTKRLSSFFCNITLHLESPIAIVSVEQTTFVLGQHHSFLSNIDKDPNAIMGWHVGMTYEEMEKEFGGGATATGDAKESKACGDSDAKTVSSSPPAACPLPTNPDGTIASKPPAPPEDHKHVYHLCRKQDWEDAKTSETPYFPRTFLKDGKFTRASLYLDDIADVANEYYSKASEPSEEWIVLELDVQFLYNGLGIAVLAAVAPESMGGSSPSNAVQCLQIFGGLSTHPTIVDSLVTAVYIMKRRDIDGKFIGMLASFDDSLGPISPKAAPPQENKDEDEKDVDEILEITPTNEAKTKKKKKGFFSKLKTKK